MHDVRTPEHDSPAPTRPEVHYLNATHGALSWFFTKDHKRIALLYLYSVTAFFLDNEPAPLFDPAALALLGVGLVLTARTLRVKDEQN